ncbi:MAG: glycosyltransferase [Butyrivibrio sp.]|jgi:N-acetylgalactosamine-N,N'-diacetylbacillosaminyl-diphospho-undecaprenol 4-alpha-N-acetylgalactosaminyltransferase|nr:glycosyltransferase [Butyrivibrio sp.]
MNNIMFFTHHLWGGGAEKTVCSLANYMNRNMDDIKVYVCVVYDDPDIHKKVDNVIVLRYHTVSENSAIGKANVVRKQVQELRRLKRKYKIDVCVSFLPGADMINVLSGSGEKRIVSVRNRESKFTHNIWKKMYVEYAYHHCDCIVAVSEVVRKDVIGFFGINENKVITIHNSVRDIPVAGECQKNYMDFISGKFVFINVARLNYEKGQEHLLRAFAGVAKQYDKAVLVILGGGELESDLRGLTCELGLQDKVLFLGMQKNPFDYMKLADVFVLSSDVEGMPNALLEAMQCDLPVISTECGAREILSPETDAMYMTEYMDPAIYGVLVPVCGDNFSDRGTIQRTEISENEKILESAMLRMLEDAELRQGYIQKAAECLKEYDIKLIARKWISTFERVEKNENINGK